MQRGLQLSHPVRLVWDDRSLKILQGIPEATTFRPTEEEFKDPLKYIDSIRAQVRARCMPLQRSPWQVASYAALRTCPVCYRLLSGIDRSRSLMANAAVCPLAAPEGPGRSALQSTEVMLKCDCEMYPRRRSAASRAWCRRPASGRPSPWTGAPTACRRTASASPSASS